MAYFAVILILLFTLLLMKNLTFSFLLGLLAAANANAQFVTDFEYYLYIRDYFGNKDSVLLGYANNTNISFSDYGTDLGTTPFNDTLEIRVTDYGMTPGTFTQSWKKGYMYADCADGAQTSGFYIAFSAMYPPVTFSWNSNDFQDDCRNNSTITTSEMYLQHPWFDEALHITMSQQDTMYLRLDTAIWESYSYPQRVLQWPMQSGDTANLYFVVMALADDSLSTSIEENQAASISVYPTATSSQININSEIEPVEKVLLYNLQGQVWQQWHGYTNQVDISQAAAGMYILEVQTKKHRRREKIIKY